MTIFAVLATLIAWWGATRSNTHGTLKLLQLLVFVVLGFLMLVFGGFTYWWDTNSYTYPERGNLAVPVCGALILLAELVLSARSDAN